MRSDRYMWRANPSSSRLSRAQVDAILDFWDAPRRGFWKRLAFFASSFFKPLDSERVRLVLAIADTHPALIVRVGLREVSGIGPVCTLLIAEIDELTVAIGRDAEPRFERLTQLMHSAGDMRIDCAGTPPAWMSSTAKISESPAEFAARMVAKVHGA